MDVIHVPGEVGLIADLMLSIARCVAGRKAPYGVQVLRKHHHRHDLKRMRRPHRAHHLAQDNHPPHQEVGSAVCVIPVKKVPPAASERL